MVIVIVCSSALSFAFYSVYRQMKNFNASTSGNSLMITVSVNLLPLTVFDKCLLSVFGGSRSAAG